MTPEEVSTFLATPPAPPSPALVADVRRFFASFPPDSSRERRIEAWRDDANESTSAGVVDMLRGEWTGGLARSIARSLIARIETPKESNQ
jgi:hypothetical protein